MFRSDADGRAYCSQVMRDGGAQNKVNSQLPKIPNSQFQVCLIDASVLVVGRWRLGVRGVRTDRRAAGEALRACLDDRCGSRASSVPPWPSAICRLRARPMPDPPGFVVKNGTNRLPVLCRPGPFILDAHDQHAVLRRPVRRDAATGFERSIGRVAQQIDQQLFELIGVRVIASSRSSHRASPAAADRARRRAASIRRRRPPCASEQAAARAAHRRS